MSWLTEDPTLLLVTGALVIAALAVALAKTGRVAMIAWMLAVAAMVGIGVLTERLIVTEREEVEKTIEQVRRAFLTNDANKVLAHISTESDHLRQRVVSVLRIAELMEARITDGPHIEVNNFTTPPSATAELIAVVKGRVRSDTGQRPARYFLRLIKPSGRWLIEEADEEPLVGRR